MPDQIFRGVRSPVDTGAGVTVAVAPRDEEWLTDIASGTWVTLGGPNCDWERESGSGGELSDIITNNFGPGTQTVDMRPTDVGVKTSGCGDGCRSTRPRRPVPIPPNLAHPNR
jgi:hypothetical protein